MMYAMSVIEIPIVLSPLKPGQLLIIKAIQCIGINLLMPGDVLNASPEIGQSVADMKVLMKPIEMIAWFDAPGTPHPIRFRYEGNVVKVEQIIRLSEEKLAGNRMKVFECQSQINGQLKRFELKYELNTCKWFLYKI